VITTAVEHGTRAQLAAFRALACSARLAIIDQLGGGPLCGSDLRERLQLSPSLLTHHLQVLHQSGLVDCRYVGRCIEVSLDLEGFDRVRAALPSRTAISRRRSRRGNHASGGTENG
jgi:ArsR family transcriptional regulator